MLMNIYVLNKYMKDFYYGYIAKIAVLNSGQRPKGIETLNMFKIQLEIAVLQALYEQFLQKNLNVKKKG